VVGVLEPCVLYPADTEIIANVVTSAHHLSATMITSRIHRMTELFARLAPGADLETARTELRSVYGAMKRQHPEAYPANAMLPSAKALTWPPPINPLQVHSEWFILHYHGSTPTPRARPAVVFSPSHPGCPHRVRVNVIHLLHEEALTEHRHRAGVMIHKGVLVSATLRRDTQFLQRTGEAAFFQIADHPVAENAVDAKQGF